MLVIRLREEGVVDIYDRGTLLGSVVVMEIRSSGVRLGFEGFAGLPIQNRDRVVGRTGTRPVRHEHRASTRPAGGAA